MKQFFKFVFATFIGIILSFALLVFILVGIITTVGSDNSVAVEPNSVLHVAFKYPIKERTPYNPLANIGFLGLDEAKAIGLNDILSNIKKAKTDDQIKGIFLDESYMLSGQATTEEIRNALIDFKTSKKFIIAYAEIYTQNFYYLASVADKIYINPKGYFDFSGFSAEYTFFKGSLEKLGIEAQIIKVGTFKSAVEPFILDKMSDANRLQVNSYLGSLYEHFLKGISASRKVPQDSLYHIANELKIRNAEDAVKYKLVDAAKYRDQVLDEMKKLTDTDAKEKLPSISLYDYGTTETKSSFGSGNSQIAVIYAAGDIGGGEGDDKSIGSELISRTLRKVRQDDKVKAVVLRINSPGGSALASDVIWREVALTKKAKPIIVSMGDVAASGGYYIACAADSIFAQPNTITGSIGIFAILPNMQHFLNDKLGLTFDGVKTGKFADLGDISRPLTPEERDILQFQVNRGYETFTGIVADGRKKTVAYIDSIGQGRVWTGTQALKIGLVDRLGNIDDAIASAANKAKISEYKLVSYPEQKNVFKNFGLGLSSEIKTYLLRNELGEAYPYYQQIKSLTNMRGLQMRMPNDATIK